MPLTVCDMHWSMFCHPLYPPNLALSDFRAFPVLRKSVWPVSLHQWWVEKAVNQYSIKMEIKWYHLGIEKYTVIQKECNNLTISLIFFLHLIEKKKQKNKQLESGKLRNFCRLFIVFKVATMSLYYSFQPVDEISHKTQWMHVSISLTSWARGTLKFAIFEVWTGKAGSL